MKNMLFKISFKKPETKIMKGTNLQYKQITRKQKADPSPTKKRRVLKTNLTPQSVPSIVDNRLPG